MAKPRDIKDNIDEVVAVGRPRDPAKISAILASAKTLFFQHGFESTTIEHIAAHAKVSKVTIYNRCGDKAALFEALVRQQSDIMLEQLAPQTPVTPVRVDASNGTIGGTLQTVQQRLNAFGVTLIGFLLHPDHVALDRILSVDLPSNTDLRQRFFHAGPANCRKQVAQVLAQAAQSGQLAIEDPVIAAEDLLSLWKGFADMEVKFGVIPQMTPDDIAIRVQRGTAKFMKIYEITR